MKNKTFLHFALLLSCVFVLRNADAQENQSSQSPPSIDVLISAMQKREKIFLEDTTQFSISTLLKKTEPLLTGEKVFLSRVRYLQARDGDDWFSRSQVLDEYSIGTQKKQPFTETMCVKKGCAIQWNTDSEQCYVDPLVKSNFFLYWDYTRFLGINVYRHIAESNDVPFGSLLLEAKSNPVFEMLNDPFFPDSFEQNGSSYQVSPAQEKIDGFSCWVVEWAGMDKIWIDLEHGGAIRQRVTHYSPNKPIQSFIRNKDYREVKAGLWLPFAQIVDVYANPETRPQDQWGKPLRRVYYEVEDMQIGQVDKAVFDVSPPVGTYVVDMVRKMDYTISSENSDPFSGPLEKVWPQLRFNMVRAVLVAAGAILVFFAIWKMANGQRSSSPP